jgi:hypothetical protein
MASTAIALPAVADVPAPTPGSLTRHTISASYVSGVSADGFMTDQLHAAYSGTFNGAGIFTCGLLVALHGCLQGFGMIGSMFMAKAVQGVRSRPGVGT